MGRNKKLGVLYKERKKEAIKYLGSACSKCGIEADAINFPIFDFHHENPDTKKHHVGNMLRNNTWDKILNELDKCVLLCSNCHRLLHYYE